MQEVEVTEEPKEQSNLPMSWAARMRAKSAAAAGLAAMPVPAQVPVPAKVPEPVVPKDEEVEVSEPVEVVAATRPPPREQNRENFRNNRYGNREGEDSRPRVQNDDRNQIFVGGLPMTMSEEDIRSVFNRYGTIRYVRINQNTSNRPGAGFGFVTFSQESEAQAALANRDDIFFNSLQLNIEEKKTKMDHRGPPRGNNDRGPPRDSGRGGPRGGRGGYGGQQRDGRNWNNSQTGQNNRTQNGEGRGGGANPGGPENTRRTDNTKYGRQKY